LDLAGHEPDRFRIIDAQQSEAEVTQAIEQILEAHFLTYAPKIPS
jgi:thymidylate kinase